MRETSNSSMGSVVVAIPVRDEQQHIALCLHALTQQIDRKADHIVLLVNNTTDDTVSTARTVPMAAGTTLHIVERTLPPALANAGHARRLAMEEAARLAGPAGILLTTDADGQADHDWISANLAEIAAGADAVAGWVDLDPADWSNIPIGLHEDNAKECAYDALCDEMHALLDPDPADPMPRHTQNSGASIAVTASAYHRAGGIPRVPTSEDRAFLAALRRADARIRHSLACHVTVSGRVVGRAAGGMADTIRRRLTESDEFFDARLEPADDCARRATVRRRFRLMYEGREALHDLPAMTGVTRGLLERLCRRSTFGAAWAELEAASPALQHRLVRVADAAAQTARAAAIVSDLRAAAVGQGGEAERTEEPEFGP